MIPGEGMLSSPVLRAQIIAALTRAMQGDDYWPPGEAYQTPEEPKPLIPRCPVCSARHDTPVPWCPQNNEQENTDDRT